MNEKNSLKFKKRTAVLAVASCLSMTPWVAEAAGLGRLTVLSSLGQPLRAEMEIAATKEELAAMTARLAPVEVFKQAGVDYSASLGELRFSVEKRSKGRAVVKVSSLKPVNEPFLDFLVELNWPSGRLVREYTFLLDPPEMAQGKAVRSVADAKIVDMVRSTDKKVAAPLAKPQAPATVTPATAPAAEKAAKPLNLQARLLRVLQERSVTPLGSTRAIQVDISLVCATHRRLREEVARGSFREDLYYRLNGLAVTLPPLRERSDLRALVSKLAAVEAVSRDLPVRFSEGAMQAIEAYRWPGNIRQLHNVIRVAIALLDDDETLITETHLPEELFEEPFPSTETISPPSHDPWAAAPLEGSPAGSLEEISRQAAMRTLEAV